MSRKRLRLDGDDELPGGSLPKKLKTYLQESTSACHRSSSIVWILPDNDEQFQYESSNAMSDTASQASSVSSTSLTLEPCSSIHSADGSIASESSQMSVEDIDESMNTESQERDQEELDHIKKRLDSKRYCAMMIRNEPELLEKVLTEVRALDSEGRLTDTVAESLPDDENNSFAGRAAWIGEDTTKCESIRLLVQLMDVTVHDFAEKHLNNVIKKRTKVKNVI